jgi:dihydroorotate dehydrogenase
MGLPNEGHAAVASRLQRLHRQEGCPLGASVSAEPGLDAAEAIPELIDGMMRYEGAGVDYLELNESCPNVPGHATTSQLDEGLLRRLDAVADGFLAKRNRRLPVVVKLSTDTALDQIPSLVRELVDRRFDGIILGNTSTRYADHREHIHKHDRALFDYFTNTYGGGLSGDILRSSSLQTCIHAAQAVRELKPAHEFHVVRCGGVMSAADILETQAHGVLLHQWYVGYFEGFAQHGHGVYRALAESMRETRTRTES